MLTMHSAFFYNQTHVYMSISRKSSAKLSVYVELADAGQQPPLLYHCLNHRPKRHTRNACICLGVTSRDLHTSPLLPLYLPAQLCAGWLVGWMRSFHAHLGTPNLWTDEAMDASGQESTTLLMTLPSNAPYVTYTDADGQVYSEKNTIKMMVGVMMLKKNVAS